MGGYTSSPDAATDMPAVDHTIAPDAPPDVAPDVAPDVTADTFDATPDVFDASETEVGCSSDAMCVGNASGAICDVATGRCVECLASRDTCPADRHCDASSNRCLAGCRSDEGCAAASTDGGAGASLRCDTTTRACVECLTDEHCPPGNLCVGQRCVMGCTAARACPAGGSCCGGACVDAMTNIAHCGACDRGCSVAHAAPACSAGACVVGSCTAPFADCNATSSDGCETDTQSTVAHCGACMRACPAPAHAVATCAAGTCGFRCDAGFADCDGSAANGCEVTLATDASNCGACATRCALANATAACVAGRCAVAACVGAALDCDGDPTDGCEVDGSSALTHCGRCDVSCPTPAGATPTCVAGVCGARCVAGFADCDGVTTNGCEVDTRTAASNCGACGRACMTTGASATRCEAGACVVTCAMGRADCDGNTANGCEVTTTTDVANCGACGRACAATFRCVDGACLPPLPVSCAALLRRDPTTVDGSYTIAPVGGAPMTAYCDVSTGRGYTFVTGRSATNAVSDILAACPAGTTAFEVRSEAHADALRRQVRRLSSTGAWYWANHFTGPTSTCPALAARTGWLRSATDWVDASIRPAFLAPLDIHENCNLDGVYDPVPISDRDGYANRDCAPCTVLYNARERSVTATVVCSVNDVAACPAGYDDCNGVAADGCETRTAVDVANCGRCGRACAAGLSCGAGTCVSTIVGAVYTPPAPPIPTGAPAVMATGIRGPQGLAVAPDGAVFVSALVAGTIVRIDPAVTPGIVTTWATGFSEPAQITFDAAGNLLVAERAGNRLTRVTVNPDGSAGARSTVASGFSGPWGVTVDTSGNYLVSNEFGSTVDRVASTTGAVTRGVITGYNSPLDMRFDLTGRLIVGQYFGTALNDGALVHRYDSSLRLLRSSTGFSGPIGIAIDASGNAYVANWDGGTSGAGRILRLADDGTLTLFYRGLNGPHGIAFDARGGLWIADYVTDRVLRLGGS